MVADAAEHELGYGVECELAGLACEDVRHAAEDVGRCDGGEVDGEREDDDAGGRPGGGWSA